MKKVLIISPYFSPANAADMQRVRMSLPYFEEFGWQAEVVKVKNEAYDISLDHLLLESIPKHIIVHEVKALSKKYTSKLGLGSIALRSLWYYLIYVNKLLKSTHFDLIYFSTTQFPVCICGAYWKKKFGIPYVIDMQDPWHSTYYLDKPKHQRPPKYWFSYRLNKWLEPIAMRNVSGLISVSQAYLDTIEERYPITKFIPKMVITFGAFKKDFDIALKFHSQLRPAIEKSEGEIKIVYIGRGGHDMRKAVILLLNEFKKLLLSDHLKFQQFKFYFVGTSYAPKGKGVKTIEPIAQEMGLANYVVEQTDRISYYESLRTLKEADALIVLGSDDPQYTASKIYPYILAEKPLLGIFNSASSAFQIIKDCKAGFLSSLENEDDFEIKLFLNSIFNKPVEVNWAKFKTYSAEEMTKNQCLIFNEII